MKIKIVTFFNFHFFTSSARVAQLVERQAFNLNVQGSSPCSGEYFFLVCNMFGVWENEVEGAGFFFLPKYGIIGKSNNR